jgi:hypothetical protein
VFACFYWVDKPLTHDEREYLELAASLTERREFTYERVDGAPQERFGRAPGYPLFLAMTGVGNRHYDHSPARVKLVQSFVGAATVWLIGLIALHAAGPFVGVGAAAIAAVHPPLVWISAYVLSESLYSAVALFAAFLLQIAAGTGATTGPDGRAPAARVLQVSALAGAVTGVAILIRPAMLFYLPLAPGWLLVRRQGRLAAAFVVAAAMVVAPWTMRNAIVHGRLVVVASEGGITFWTGNHPLAVGEGDLSANPPLKAANENFRRAHPHLSPEELEPLYYRDALKSIGANPLHWLSLLARKTFYTFIPVGPSYTLHSTRYRAASELSYLLILPVAIVGLGRLWRSTRRPTAVMLLAASAVLVSLIFFPQERFRIPVIDPVLIVCAAAALAAPGRAGTERS